MNIQQWCCGEITFQDPAGSHDVVCGISAEFTAPSGRVIRREAFWDGEDVYKLRFAPTELGSWNYRVTGLSTGDAVGAVNCVPYTGELPVYRHGFLKVGPRGKYLCHDDGTPFFWLGDTHWGIIHDERFNDSNDPRFESQFKSIVDRRAEQHFNVYQCNFHASMPGSRWRGQTPYFTKTEAGWEPNLELLQNNVDPKLAYLAEKGFQIAIGYTWGASILQPDAVEYYKMAARYLMARYGAYPVIWTLAGESGGYDNANRDRYIEGWREVALEVERLDDYGHLQTTHYTNERPFADYYQNESWYDFTLHQAGHGDYPIDRRPFRAHRKKYPNKPFVEGESMYENVLTLEPNGRRRATPLIMRRVAYLAIQCGGCGYTYGCQGMWFLQWDEPEPGSEKAGFGSSEPWYKGIDYPGAYQLGYMKDFYESIGWHRLSPLDADAMARPSGDRVGITLTSDDLEALFMPSVSADEDMSTVVAYFAENNNRQPVSLCNLPYKCYKAQWFSPEAGEYTLIDDNIVPENGAWTSPLKPFEDDAVLLLTAVK